MSNNEVRLPDGIVSGEITLWCVGPTKREQIVELFTNNGFADNIPDERTDEAALRAAMQEKYGAPNKIIQPHQQRATNGYEVVHVDRQKGQNNYTVDFCARVAEGIVIVYEGKAEAERLQEAFDRHKVTMTGSAIGKSMVEILNRLQGISLRPSGGVYWVPQSGIAMWKTIAAGIQSAAEGASNIYHLATEMNAELVRALKDVLTNEVESVATDLTTEIVSGKLGEAAMKNRKEKATELHARVEVYASILGDALQSLKNVTLVATQAAASALAVEQHGEGGEFAGIF